MLYLVFDSDITLAVTNIYLTGFFSPGVEFYNRISVLFRVILLYVITKKCLKIF